MSERFIPSITQLKTATEELPDVELWPEEEYVVPIEGRRRSYSISFRKVKYKSRAGDKTCRWMYDGKVMVRNSDLTLSTEESS